MTQRITPMCFSRTVFAGLAVMVAGCDAYEETPVPADPYVEVVGPLTANVLEGRVRHYAPDVDYFPDKTSFRYSEQISIEYHNNYKVLTLTPAPNPRERFQYVLVQRGTPAPRLSGNARTIEVPIRNFILAHGELFGAAEIVGLADRLVATSRVTDVRAPGIRAGIERGRIVAIGSGSHVDVERVIQLQPDLVMTYWSLNPSYDAHPVLDQAGIQTVILASHWETSVLATAEWMKVMAVLFNREREVNAIFGGIAERYEELAARARAQPTKPVVLTRMPFRHTWYVMPEPDEIADAGGRYFWSGEDRPKAVDVEAVAQRARDADVWVITFPTPIGTQDELLTREPRLAVFRAVRDGEVWNYDLADIQPEAPYHDFAMRPDLVLADLVKILHPALVPDHELVFYRRLGPSQRFGAPRVDRDE